MFENKAIDSENICLRPLTSEHSEAMRMLFNVPQTTKLLHVSDVDGAALAQASGQHWRKHGHGLFAITEKLTKKFLGRVGVRKIEQQIRGCDYEFVVAVVPEAYGQKVAERTSLITLADHFSQREASVGAIVSPQNTPCHGLIQRLGFFVSAQNDIHNGHEYVAYQIDSNSIG